MPNPYVLLTTQYPVPLLFVSEDRDRAVAEGKRYAAAIGATHELQTGGEVGYAINPDTNIADVFVGAFTADSPKLVNDAIRAHQKMEEVKQLIGEDEPVESSGKLYVLELSPHSQVRPTAIFYTHDVDEAKRMAREYAVARLGAENVEVQGEHADILYLRDKNAVDGYVTAVVRPVRIGDRETFDMWVHMDGQR